MVGSAPSHQAAVDALEATSPDLRSVLLLEGGDVVAHAGEGDARVLGELAGELLGAADGPGVRAGGPPPARIEVSSPAGGVFAVRGAGPEPGVATLVAVTGPGVLPSLVLYDLRMALSGLAAAPLGGT